jgi:hypothetical protein
MELERETVRRMAECFGRQTCCRCGRTAERLMHNRFYCGSHFPCGRSARWEPSRKVYKSPWSMPVRV